MSTSTMPSPADVVARASAAIRSLNDDQLVAVMNSSRRIQKRVLPTCWGRVKTAAPDLADALDALYAREVPEDLPRFEALATEHRRQLNKAVTGRTGKLTAALVMTAVLLGVATALIGLAGTASTPIVATGSILTAGLLIGGYTAGHRLARRSGNWLFADPGAAASIVWDAGIDAAAATALKPWVGHDGLTPDVLRALAAVWTGAGLDTDQLIRPPKPEPRI